MDAILQAIDITNLTASGLLTIAILMLFRGNLVVKASYDDVRKDRDNWKQAYFNQDATIRELTSQVGQLLSTRALQITSCVVCQRRKETVVRVPWGSKRTRREGALAESEQAKQSSQAHLGEVRAQRTEVDQVVKRLFARRQENCFGDSIAQAYRERYQT